MSTYPWQPGMIITAGRLRAGKQSGTVSVTPVTGAANEYQLGTSVTYYRGSASVVFDTPFTSVPRIQLTGRSTTPGVLLECSYADITTTGFTALIARTTGTTTVVDWEATEQL